MPDRILIPNVSKTPQILATMKEPSDNENKDGLYYEKQLLVQVMKQIEGDEDFFFIPVICRRKNPKDSNNYRKKGNEVLESIAHTRTDHETAWKLYSQSIALAPNNSEELALAYGERSTLFNHMEKFNECMIDCEKALNITKSELLRAKLLLRKAICLTVLKKENAMDTCMEITDSLHQLSLENNLKNKYISKINEILNNVDEKSSETFDIFENSIANNDDDDDDRDEDASEVLPFFARSKDIPCASDAVEFKYNEKLGRHIVATRSIQPGEILTVEKSYHTFIYPDGQYTHCSHCAKASWNNIPCDKCIYDVYCSKECKVKAWTKYHQYECEVFPHLWDIDEDIKRCPHAIRLMLISVYKAGGIELLQDELISNNQCTDLCSKGFSSDGIFDSSSSRGANSFNFDQKLIDHHLTPTLAKIVCNGVYFLARESNFFGKKFTTSPTEILLEKNVLFVGSLLLRYMLMLNNNVFTYDEYFGDFHKKSRYGVSLFPFCSFFKHSCDPNAHIFTTKDNELAVYAKRNIEEGEQICIALRGITFLYKNREERKRIFEQFNFICECQACLENWSHICLPSVEDLLEKSPLLANGIKQLIENSYAIKIDTEDDRTTYTAEIMEEVVDIIQKLSEKVTVNCTEYNFFAEYMGRMYVKSFGNWFDIPDDC